ncbi:MAG: hypothetical protein ABFS46_13955, partial [Myxococcota bacterium]
MRWGWAALAAGFAMSALGPSAAGDPPAPREPPGELRIVTYNTHGLPAWIARDDPVWRFPRIGRLLSAYDVALVQED